MSAKTTFTILGAFVAIWAVLGFMDVSNNTTTGYSTDADNAVTTISEGGPGEAAGMEVGDVVQSVDGIDIEDSRALSRRPRATVGQVRTIVVDRGGETVDLSLTQAAQSSSQKVNSYIGILLGVVFLGMGLWAYFTTGTRAAYLLATAGVLFGVVFAGGPYLGTSALATIATVVGVVCIAMAFAVLLHFMIVFPDGTEPDKRWVYGPAALVGLLLAGLIVFEPDTSGGFDTVLQGVLFVWIVGYLGMTLFKMFRTWSRASAEDRSRHGLNALVIGTGLGLGLLLVSVVISIVLPSVTLPGAQWFVLALALVPICCGAAVVKSAAVSPQEGGSYV